MSVFWLSVGTNFLCDLGRESFFIWVSVFLCVIIKGKSEQVDFISDIQWVQFQVL